MLIYRLRFLFVIFTSDNGVHIRLRYRLIVSREDSSLRTQQVESVRMWGSVQSMSLLLKLVLKLWVCFCMANVFGVFFSCMSALNLNETRENASRQKISWRRNGELLTYEKYKESLPDFLTYFQKSMRISF
jgi:hypothetical protein